MTNLEIAITGGTVATASDTFQCDIGIRDGKIVALGHDLAQHAADVIDASGKFVLPGGIDSHVHIAQPSGEGIVMADDFESATLSALFGGNTTIMPFCLQERGQSLRKTLSEYHSLADHKCYTDVSFHLIICDPTPELLGQELPAAVHDGYKSFKVFMTYDNLRLNDAELLATFDVARDLGATVMVHCENEDAIRFLIEKHEAANKLRPSSHASTRPVAAEREATHRAVSLAEIVDIPVVIVHVSNGQAIDEITQGRKRGSSITAETCPQYLVLTSADLEGMDWEGAKFVCSPPPRDTADQIACWRGLKDGTFDLFSSDHCPFKYNSPDGKLNPRGAKNFRHIPNGIPGVETRMPILFSEGVNKGRIDLNRFVALTATNHARTYGLYPRKGTIAIGSDADIAIWDPDLEVTVRHADLHDGADYSPYEGLELRGWPVTVLLRGKVMIRDRKLEAQLGDGQYLPR
ncbi:dihydropyrimidinase [Roseinatronobacter bogoriensis]|uniref:D-hydantoinase n=1 Tax=Roseinatronobacter bogoriensis subsp. barguzinensis TaxID=441209 RepID=A0A2K8K4Y7_9RHOB|nr:MULTISPECIES: dihydropyrimidinase [Rhodobaca]ATX64522.1 dihydropyrimidinase [Rhodobaca barguzinensis]MBB4209237.1 dihydropyrimidinase [Rhodobaca bogoriensis DSM 18756]TDW36237.1 dihydropyrimidinase [Rhodobaca barguzinensis]TDY67635.1 dihydropyrimidinase [Rhodobaca bogoriensis DSM 18756]